MFKDINKVTFDDGYLEEQAKESPNLFLSLNKSPLFIDEIQYVPSLFRYLKMYCDNNNEYGQYILSGSQPFRLMELASDSMAGRVAIIEFPTLSLREIQGIEFNDYFLPTMEYIQKRHPYAKKPEDIWSIIHRGFYPELQNKNVNWYDFYTSYVKTYLEKDIRDLNSLHDLTAFRKFMVACASRTGSVLVYANIASEVGKDEKTVKNWISILESSGIIYLLKPFYHNTLKRAIKSPKLYFRDTGLAAFLTRWTTPEVLANGAQNENFFETFVISELIKSMSNTGLDYKQYISFYRDRDGKNETDFIIEMNGTVYPIEIKSSESVDVTMSSSFRVFDTLKDKKRGMGAIICSNPTVNYLRDNVLQIPYWYI
ncbi:MAG: ATP-binding protein [Erysipelotrichaceae bacterium]